MSRIASTCFFALFLTSSAFAADIQTLQNGKYLLRETQEWPPFSQPKAPGPCDVIATLTISDTGEGVFEATIEDSFAGKCTTAPAVVPNSRTYHIQATGTILCGMSYQSKEKDPSETPTHGDNLSAATINDYRAAPASCTRPTQGPAIVPVLSLQELTIHGAINWESYQ